MKKDKEIIKWAYHLVTLGLVIYELTTIQDAPMTIGNWAAVFVVVGLISTFFSVVLIGFQLGRLGMSFLLSRILGND